MIKVELLEWEKDKTFSVPLYIPLNFLQTDTLSFLFLGGKGQPRLCQPLHLNRKIQNNNNNINKVVLCTWR